MDENPSENASVTSSSTSSSSSSSSSSSRNSQNELELETVSFSETSSSSSSSSSSLSDGALHPFAAEGRIVEDDISSFTIPNTIHEAQTKLSALLVHTRSYDDANRRARHQFVLRLLTQYPDLAFEPFVDAYEDFRWPLSHLLAARAPFDTIKAVYDMYPEAIALTQGSHGDYLAHDACWYGNDSSVIRFIVLQYPEALTKRNEYKRLPIHDALRSYRISSSATDTDTATTTATTTTTTTTTTVHTPLETIRFLLEMYPEWIPDNDGKNYLESAFSYGYDVETLQYIAEQWPDDLDAFQCQSTGAFTLDLPRANIIAQFIIPKVKTLRLDPPTWSLEGFVHLMHALAGPQSAVQMLELLEFPGELILQEQLAQTAFQTFLETHTTVQVLIISFPRIFNLLENFCDVCLRIMGQGLRCRNNTTLQRVVLKRMHLTNDGILNDLLRNAKAPASLVLEQMAFQQPVAQYKPYISSEQDNNNNNNNNNSENFTSAAAAEGKIESLRFVDCTIRSSCFVNLLHRVAQIPSLKCLNIGISPTVPGARSLLKTNLTEPLVELLKQERLEELGISYVFQVDMQPICDVLKTNTTLHTLLIPSSTSEQENLVLLEDVLAHHNSTLQECAVKPAGRHDIARDKIILWTRLNRFGREQVRKDGATKLELWKRLNNVQKDTSLKLPLDKLNLQYGLLRECPYLWCE